MVTTMPGGKHYCPRCPQDERAWFPNREEYRRNIEEAHKHGLCAQEAMAIIDDFARTIHDLRNRPRTPEGLQ
jgi:hypothetical protein